MADAAAPNPPVSFETHPTRYRHWRLSVEGDAARLAMAVDPAHALRPGYELKLNSYDLAVDIELADAVQRLRFEHPEVKVVIVTSDRDRIFCSGANIYMLGSSTHGFKVNFCKFTNETRLAIEDASAASGQRYLAACNGPTAGGGYELALACDEILLVEDGSSTVSLPEVPLLGVLPGTGGLTRVTDKRKVRRDLADVFCTTAEGVKGKRAVEWRLIDGTAPRSRWDAAVKERAQKLAAMPFAGADKSAAKGLVLPPLEPTITDEGVTYKHVRLAIDGARRTAELTINAPTGEEPTTAAAFHARGAESWALRAFRELDDALLRLRFNHADVGLVLLRTRGDRAALEQVDEALARHQDDWLVREITLHMARVLRRLDNTAKTLFAVVDAESAYLGPLFEVLLAADRSYALETDGTAVRPSRLSGGLLPTVTGLTRLEVRFHGEPERATAALRAGAEGSLDADAANAHGLFTVLADDIDFADELRVAVEERASLSPDALTGMESNLRTVGAENGDAKIFGRLSAWQNWIFIRPNAVGPHGALSLYGKPERPQFDYRRT